MCTQKGNKENNTVKDINVSEDLCVYAKNANIPDNEVCMIELENGTFGSQTNNFFIGNYYSRVYEIIGKTGLIRICLSLLPHHGNKDYQGTLEVFPRFDEEHQRFEFNYHNRIHYNGSPGVYEHFYDLMCGKTQKVYSPVNEAFAAEMIAVAAYKSSDNGEYITIKDLLPDNLTEWFSKIFNNHSVK